MFIFPFTRNSENTWLSNYRTTCFSTMLFPSVSRPLRSFFKNDGSSNQDSACRRNKNTGISGRSNLVGQFTEKAQDEPKENNDASQKARFHLELRKIPDQANTGSNLVGREMEDSTIYHVPHSEFSQQDNLYGEIGQKKEVYLQERARTLIGTHGLCWSDYSDGSCKNALNSMQPKIIFEQRAEKRGDKTEKPQQRAFVVDKNSEFSTTKCHKKPSSQYLSLDRRFRCRLRWSSWRRSNFPRFVVKGYEILTYKCQRIIRSGIRSKFRYNSSRQFYRLVRRQCASGILRSKKRVKSFPNSTKNFNGTLSYLETETTNSDPSLYPRNKECNSRFFIPRQSNSFRMGNASRSVQESDERTGLDTSGGCHGNTMEHQSLNLHLPVRPSSSCRSGLLRSKSQPMVDHIYFSSSESDFEGFEPSNIVSGENYTNCPILAEPTLVPSINGKDTEKSAVDSLSTTGSSGGDGSGLFAMFISLHRLDFLKHIYFKKFGSEVSNRLIKAWRQSTEKNYSRCWNEFKDFIFKGDYQEISERSVLEFLESLFTNRSLSPRTILTYRNALSKPLQIAFGIDTSESTFRDLARAQFIARPPSKRIVPKWELDGVLKLLSSRRFTKRDISLKDLLVKTLFLICLATGNRGSEIAALVRHGVCWRSDGSAVLPVKPGFLYKNQSQNRSPPNIVIVPLPSQDKSSLCPSYNQKLYLKRSSDGQGNAIFLHPETGRNLQRPSLSSLLCSLIEEACPNSFPKMHDLRKQSTSLAWTRGVSPSDISAAVFWASSNTFVKHYLNPRVKTSFPCVAIRTT